jgi:hypothetical protein
VRALPTLLLAAFLLAATVGCGSHGSVKAFCAQVGKVPQLASVFDTYDPADPTAARAAFDQAVAQLRSLQKAAPGAVRSDVRLLGDVAQRFVDALSSIGDPSQVGTKLAGIEDDLARVGPASDRVVSYTRSECGIDLAPSPSTPSTTAN